MLAEAALKFGAFEFFWLGMVGVMMSGSLTGTNPIKGWLMGLLGIFVASIGLDPIHAHQRFTFDKNEHERRHRLIPALVGAFGFAEILTVMCQPKLNGRWSTRSTRCCRRSPTCCATGAPSSVRA